MNYLTLRERPRQFLALTSLRLVEFDDLLTDFAPAWERHHRYHTLEGAKRAFPAHRERANAVLAGSDTKLFFSAHLPQKQCVARAPGRQFWGSRKPASVS